MTHRIVKFLHSPLAIAAFLAAGIVVGLYAPDVAKLLAPLSKLYIDLLKMVILPLIVSSIIFSLRSIIRDPHAATYLGKAVATMLAVSAIAVVVGLVLSLTLRPGEIKDAQTRAAFGQVVSKDSVGTELEMNLRASASAAAETSLFETIVSVVPSNIFQALASGDTIKVLVFALLFGFAIGRVPVSVSDSLAHSLDTVYRACIILTRWFSLLLPFATFAMLAEQTATVGPKTLLLMIDFLITFGLAAVVLGAISIMAVSFRTRRSPWAVLRAHQDVLFMAIATRSSVACIPAMIDTLTARFGFRRDVVELLVPLQTAIMRAGPVVLFVVGPLFIAQLYGKTLTISDLVTVAALAVVLGVATAGMTGITVVMQMGVVCGYLSLPFEAAFVLFASIDAVTDTFRTLTLVITISGAIAAIAPFDPESEIVPVEDVLPADSVAPRAAE